MSVYRIVRGNDEQFQVTVTDADGAAYDLTGATVVCEVKDCPGGTLLFQASVTVTDATNGQVTIEMTSEQTASLSVGVVCFDLLITDIIGQKHTVPHDGPWWAEVVDAVTD